jgi:tetratricopeptide (TPR) repeat protein
MQMEGQGPRSSRNWRLGLGLLFALVTCWVFFDGLSGGFINDDLTVIARNPDLQSLAGLPHLLARPMWSGLPGFTDGLDVGHWRPLTSLVLALGFGLGGGPDAPLIFHLISLFLHLLATYAAFRVARRLLGSELAAGAAALLFAVHPLHVESVAWISALNDPLYGALTLFSIDAWLGWREAGSRRMPWLAALLLFAALLTKETALAALPLLLLVDVLRPKAAGSMRPLRPWLLVGAVAMLWFGLRVLVFGDALAGFDRGNAVLGMSFPRALEFRVEALGQFFAMLLMLEPPNPFRSVNPNVVWAAPALWLDFGLVALWLLALVRLRAPLVRFALLGIPIALLAVLISPNGAGQFPVSDRFAYIAVFLGGLVVAWLLEGLRAQRLRFVLSGALVVGCALLASATTERWANDEALFRTAVELEPTSPFAHWELGRTLLGAYDATGAPDALAEAELHFRVSLGLGEPGFDAGLWQDESQPLAARVGGYVTSSEASSLDEEHATIWRSDVDLLQAQLGLGTCLAESARLANEPPTAAIALFRACLERFGGDRLLELALAKALLASASRPGVEDSMGALIEAREHVRRALEADARLAEGWLLLARIEARRGERGAATAAFGRALELKPSAFDWVLEAARNELDAGHWKAAERLFGRIPADDSHMVDVLYLQAVQAARTGKLAASLERLGRLLGVDPAHQGALLTRAQVHVALGDLEAARADYEAALAHDRDSFEANYGLAALLVIERPAEARPYLVTAFGLAPPGELRRALLAQVLATPGTTPDELGGLAEIASARGDLADALALVRRGLELDPAWARGSELLRALGAR